MSAESRVLGRYLATNRYITLLKSPGTKRGFPFLRASIPERATSSTPMNEVSRGMKSCGTPASLISDVLVNGGLRVHTLTLLVRGTSSRIASLRLWVKALVAAYTAIRGTG